MIPTIPNNFQTAINKLHSNNHLPSINIFQSNNFKILKFLSKQSLTSQRSDSTGLSFEIGKIELTISHSFDNTLIILPISL